MDTGKPGSLSILVVDDVRFTRLNLARMLQRMGHTEVCEAEDGAAALRLLEGKSVDCVISDLDMPNVNGLELLKAIRTGTGSIRRSVPVVFLTGHSELEHLGPALLLDLDAFLAKPVSQQAVERCLAELFDPQKKPKHALAEANFYAEVDLAPTAPEQSGNASVEGEEPVGRAVPLANVPANAVLARDLLYANGRLLLRAGSKLSPQVLDRLRDMAALTGLAETVWILN
jgi:CheY-like chemotaxis protein